MRLILVVALIIICFSAAPVAEAQASKTGMRPPVGKKRAPIRFNGLYCESSADSKSCLRFYEDGLVLSVSLSEEVTDAQLAQIVRWFTREPEKRSEWLSEGSYQINRRKITFTTSVVYHEGPARPREVKIDYAGLIENAGAVLLLDSYSHYNGNRQNKRRFVFIKTQ